MSVAESAYVTPSDVRPVVRTNMGVSQPFSLAHGTEAFCGIHKIIVIAFQSTGILGHTGY